MTNEYWGVLVSVSICNEEGAITGDLGYLFDVDQITDLEKAYGIYHGIDLAPDQKRAMWLYLRKWIGENEGLYISYEIIDSDGVCEALELDYIGHNAE